MRASKMGIVSAVTAWNMSKTFLASVKDVPLASPAKAPTRTVLFVTMPVIVRLVVVGQASVTLAKTAHFVRMTKSARTVHAPVLAR
jgi:hypothetical protein